MFWAVQWAEEHYSGPVDSPHEQSMTGGQLVPEFRRVPKVCLEVDLSITVLLNKIKVDKGSYFSSESLRSPVVNFGAIPRLWAHSTNPTNTGPCGLQRRQRCHLPAL